MDNNRYVVQCHRLGDEEWKPIINFYKYGDFPNYEISNYGRVRNIIKQTILKGRIKKGYRYCSIRNSNGLWSGGVHILVLTMFDRHKNGLEECNHKDGIKLNNWVDNLEWLTRSGNLQHAWDNGLRDREGLSDKMKVIKKGQKMPAYLKEIWKERTIKRNLTNNPMSNKETKEKLQKILRSRERLQTNNKSGFKGVSYETERGKWRASIGSGGKSINLGYYATKEGAALAYNKAALQYHGSHAKLNEVKL